MRNALEPLDDLDCLGDTDFPVVGDGPRLSDNVKRRLEVRNIAHDWLLMAPVYLSTLATGRGERDSVVAVGVVDHDGAVLLDAGLDPTARPNPWAALQDAALDALTERMVVIYDAQFHLRLLFQSAHQAGMPPLLSTARCTMQLYAQFHGDYDETRRHYRAVPLLRAAENLELAAGNATAANAAQEAELGRQILWRVAGF